MDDDLGLELARVLRSSKVGGLPPDSHEVCDAFSNFLEPLRAAYGSDSNGSRFSRDERFLSDDGIVALTAAFDDMGWLELWGYVWWIDQAVDPIWARLQPSQDTQAGIANYTIKCGVRRSGDPGYARAIKAADGLKHLRNLLEGPTNDQIADAWISKQLTPEVDLWFFEFSHKSLAN